MEKKQIEELVAKYNEGVADPAEVKLLEQLIESGAVDLTELYQLKSLDDLIQKLNTPTPSLRVDEQFYAALGREKKSNQSFSLPVWNSLFPRLALAAGLIVVGFISGYWLQSPFHRNEVSALTEQVGELKEMMMLSLLEKESASQRLKAVSLTSDMTEVSTAVTDALITTLNQDENVNVRLAALDALKLYVNDSHVRTRLIESIAIQDSPLVQVALAELMVAIQEKKSVDALKKLLNKEGTPQEVKNKITESIQVLI